MLSVNPGALSEVGTSAGPASFVWKYCRMCALEVKQGVYIFGEEGKRLQIPEKIRKTVAILVLEEDSLPKKICTSCCTSLEAYTQFKDSVVDAQEKLSAIAKSIEKSQEQSLLQLRNKQSLKSPKRQKLYHSSLPSHSACHNMMFPTASVISAPEPDLGEPAIECDEPPSSVASISSEEEENITPKSAPECVSSNELGLKNDESTQVATQGHSPPLSLSKHPIRESKIYTSSQIMNENDDFPSRNTSSSSKSPVYSGESTVDNSQSEAHLVCGLCTSNFKDKDSLVSHHSKSHNNNDSQNEPLFGCSVCPRISSTYETIRQHIHGHRMTGMFKCPDCDKGFSTKDHLHVHITSKHNQVIVGNKSSICQGYGKQNSSTNVPVTAHDRRKYSGGSVSSASTGTNENVHNQPGESSFNQTSESAPSTSEESSTVTSDSKELVHPESGPTMKFSPSPIKNSEKNDALHALVKVDLNSSSRNTGTIDSHEHVGSQNEASNLSLNEEKDGYWKCDYCDKILRSKNGYDTHMAAHKGRRFSCNHCGVTYTQKSSLEHHIKVHHTNIDKEFECPECTKRFKTFRQLGWHKKTHEKPLSDIRCPQCEKTFKNMVSFKTHMKLHRGSKKFSCVQCPKAFYTKAKLQEHMNSHSGKRPFGCPVDNCSKVFSCFSNYAKHFKKHHHTMLGPKGRMIPPPKIVESNNNVVPVKPNDFVHQKKMQIACVKATQNITMMTQKESVITGTSSAVPKSQETTQVTTSSQSHAPSNEGHSHNSLAVHPSFQIGASVESSSTQTQTVLRPLPGIFSGSSNNLGVQTSSTSSQTFSSQTPSCSNLSLLPSNNSSGHSHNSPLPLHTTSSISTNENLSLAHTQSQSVPVGSLQSHSHHHLHHPTNVHAHNSTHSAHSNHAANSAATQTHHANQFQSQNHIQTVWQPVVLPNSKNYHNPSASSNLSTINGLELLDCAGTVHSSESLPSSNSSNSHSHSQHQQTSVNLNNPSSINAAHHATSHSSVVHAHHGVNISGPGHSSNPHIGSSHHGSSSSNVPHSTASSSGHGIPVSSTSNAVNIPSFGSLTQQNEPMELSYKDSNNFQEMPMELTKVFQRDPLELCVRQDFGHTQPLMDLSSRVVNVTVGGNSSMNVSTMSMNLNGNNSNTSSTTNSQSHYTSISNGTGSTSTSILSVPYHKTVELVERELSLNDFTGAFRQPIDLISRTEEQSHELCSEGNLVDLSLRSSFGQDQSASSFLRELIDLSSRSDSFHGEVNLTNKQHQSSSNSHSQIHHHSHSSGHHPIPKSAPTSNSVSSHHHHHNNHHTHHHHAIQSHQPSSGSGNAGAPPLQAVMYSDTNAMFNLQN